ncbi:MAG TPA: glycosyltransferase family 39 protein [Chitinophagaceae bacterium]|nr:glycosyltransferase family 39 protein [Chitinophagaceae bacterium]
MRRALPDHKTFQIITAAFMILKLCLHFFTNTNYELHRDEMLYFNMADHLSFGYATVPPLTALFAYIVKIIFGYSVFGIRFFPAILGALSLLIISKIIHELGGGLLALLIAMIAFTFSPGFLLFNTLLTPNVFEQFTWLLISYLILRLAMRKNENLWLPIGAITGISFMAKYSIIYFITGFLIALLFSEHRKLLASKKFIPGIVLAVLIFLPNIIWQYNNSWPLLYHMSELKKTQLVNMSYDGFFKDLFSLNSVASLIWLFGLGALLYNNEERKYRFLGVASSIIILLFLLSHGKAYYIMGLIPLLFALGAYTMEKYLPRLICLSFIAICVHVLVFTMPFALPVFTFEQLDKYADRINHAEIYPFSRWEDGKDHGQSQVFSDMTGWDEMTSYVAAAYGQLSDPEKSNCTIYAERNYGYAGAVHFYGRSRGLPDAITFLESYVYWSPDSIPNGPFIYINYEINGLKDKFRYIREVGEVKNKYFREKGVKVFLCREPVTNISELYHLQKKEALRKMNDR